MIETHNQTTWAILQQIIKSFHFFICVIKMEVKAFSQKRAPILRKHKVCIRLHYRKVMYLRHVIHNYDNS